MKGRRAQWCAQLIAAVILVSGGLVVGSVPTPALAADASDFDPGMLIADEVFYAPGAMSAAEVEAFLRDKGSRCVPGSSGLPCLKDYTETTPDRPANEQCAAYVGAVDESAAQVIWKSAQACGINPQAILVILQKEQGLLTASGESLVESRYRSAMGFRCPTNGECEPQYAGFANQVYSAAWRFQYYADHPNSFHFHEGRTNTIPFHPNPACGSTEVFIRNQATAGLYNYTPYQPNAAALAAGYGTGDACSTYGNRNFWARFEDWFGSTDGASHNPIGELETVDAISGGIALSGWAIDPDTTGPIYVWLTVDGSGRHLYANQARPDVAEANPEFGANHGFSARLDIAEGQHTVCVTASNVGIGSHTPLGCSTVLVRGVSPVGGLESVVAEIGGTVSVRGWAIDPDTTGPIFVWLTVNGSGRHLYANQARADVAEAQPGYGPDHGFSTQLQLDGGRYTICATASNVGLGSHTPLGCETVSVRGGSPFGNFERMAVTSEGIELTGWAVDPDTADRIYLWVTVDGAGRHYLAGTERPDVGRAFPEYGSAHGYSLTIAATPGPHRVCITAVNVGAGTHTSLGCRGSSPDVSGNRSPYGNFEAASGGPNGIEIRGWAIDPDTTAPVYLWVTIDGKYGRHIRADVERSDVGRVFPSYGSGHGFEKLLAVAPGSHRICVTASNVGPGAHTDLRCKQVTGSGGTLADVTFQSFTASNGLRSQFHIYAAQIDPRKPVGLMIQFHGDGAYEFNNPNSTYFLGGPLGLRAEAAKRNMVLLVARTPDVEGSITWWESGVANADYARDLIQSQALDRYDIDTTRVWLVGYSGGAQFVTKFLLPKYSAMFGGGGAVIFGGGGRPSITVTPFAPSFVSRFPMHWYTGALDDGTCAGHTYNALGDAQGGSAYYGGLGFTATLETPAGMCHGLSGRAGEVVGAQLDLRGVVAG